MIGRAIRFVVGISIVATVTSMIAAAVAKRRIVSEGGPESDEVAIAAVFDSVDFASQARAFRGGTFTAWFGGGDIDLRGATLDPAGAVLTVRLLYGGGRLIVPDGWVVELRSSAFMGGIGDGRPRVERAVDAPRLVIDGFMVLGGLGVVSTRDEDPTRLMPIPIERVGERDDELAAVGTSIEV